MSNLRTAAQQALEFIRWSQFVPCQSGDFPEPPSTAPQVEAALKAALAEPVQEPVAWMTHGNDLLPLFHKTKAGALAWGSEPQPLFTTPPQRKPLTEEEIWALYYALPSDDFERSDRIDFARAIEAAHGIKEGT